MDPHHPHHHATHANFMNPHHQRQNFDPRHPRPRQLFGPHQNFTDPRHPRQPRTYAPTLFTLFTQTLQNIMTNIAGSNARTATGGVLLKGYS